MSDPVTATGPVIVAGVDGSDSSKDALRWAAGAGRLTGATLRGRCMTWHRSHDQLRCRHAGLGGG